MLYKERQGSVIEVNSLQDRLLAKLYGHVCGRLLLRPLISPVVSRIGGRFLSTSLSALAVKPFVRAQRIDLSQCEQQHFISYNDFFTRKLKAGARPITAEENRLISPCDGKLSVYPIEEKGIFMIKHTPYTVASLLKNTALAHCFSGGYAWVFRLSVEDYHRYIYVDSGEVSSQYQIDGVFHTVNPVANDQYAIYKENTRTYSLLNSAHFGTILMMEVGALLVGKIENRGVKGSVVRGQEKGNFAFGGSTIILLTQPAQVAPDADLLSYTAQGVETKVKLGEGIGNAL